MAKRKTPKVKDLKPQINTIEKNELTDLQKVVGTLDMRYAQLGKIESEKHQILHIVAGHSLKELSLERLMILLFSTKYQSGTFVGVFSLYLCLCLYLYLSLYLSLYLYLSPCRAAHVGE